MALTIPSYPNPCDPANPLTSAYAWASMVVFDLAGSAGSVTLNVNPNSAAWNSRPVDQLTVYFGADLGGSVPMATITSLMSDPVFEAAFNTVGSKIYAALKAAHPLLAAATEVS